MKVYIEKKNMQIELIRFRLEYRIYSPFLYRSDEVNATRSCIVYYVVHIVCQVDVIANSLVLYLPFYSTLNKNFFSSLLLCLYGRYNISLFDSNHYR